jgi:hypothetical protein
LIYAIFITQMIWQIRVFPIPVSVGHSREL